jgi:hypothetical protein
MGNDSHGQVVPSSGTSNVHWASYCVELGLQSFGQVGWFGVKTDFGPLAK